MECHRFVSGEVVRSRSACFVSNCNTVSHNIEIYIWNRPNVIFSATTFKKKKNWIKNKKYQITAGWPWLFILKTDL